MKKKKKGISFLPRVPNSIIASFHVLHPAWKIHMPAWIAGEDPARRESSLGWLNMLESWKKSQLKEWFTRVDAARGFALWFDSWLVSTINRWIISLFLGRRVRREESRDSNRGRKFFKNVVFPGKRLFSFRFRNKTLSFPSRTRAFLHFHRRKIICCSNPCFRFLPRSLNGISVEERD